MSLATAQSAELRGGRTSSRPTEETVRETATESTTTHDGQNQDLEKARGGNKSRDERRDLGPVTEGSCDSSTSRDTMIVATANVRTLHPKEEKESRSRFGGTTMLGKLELLEIAMHDTATDVVGLQESRSRQAGIFHVTFYRKYCDAADSNGNASCQLWVTASSPRLLVVTGRRANSGLLLDFVVTQATYDEKQTFWTQFGQQ